MGKLFNRTSRNRAAHLSTGAASVAAGAATGASIGKVGILAGGAGYSVGAVPLAAVGALTGAALYEVVRSLVEGDASSASAAAIGAAAGAATSAHIGGIGVAAGGSAIGVGMASMAAGGIVIGLGIAGLNHLLRQGVDPEELLDRAIQQMEADLQNTQKASLKLLTSQKQLQRCYDQTQAEVKQWEQRARLALQKGNEYLAREALVRKKTQADILHSLEVHFNQETASAEDLRHNSAFLEAKIAEAKTVRTSFRVWIQTAELNGQLPSKTAQVDTNATMTAFDRVEEKILQMEARSQVATELKESDLQSQFSALASASDVDEELEELKRMLAQP